MAVVRTGQAPHQSRDIGPAAAFGGADNGRLASLEVRTPADMRDGAQGSGPVEVRHETEHERTARMLSEAFSVPSAVKEERVALPVIPPAAAPTFPCATCLHEPVCRLKDELPRDPAVLLDQPHIIAPGLWLVFTGARVECDHYLGEVAKAPAPAPVRPPMGSPEALAASRRREAEARVARAAAAKRFPLPRDRAERLTVVVDAILTTPNAAAAGAKLGVSDSRVGQIVAEARKDGTLPAEVDELLRSRGANVRTPA